MAYRHLGAVPRMAIPCQASPCRGQLPFPTGFVRKRLPRSELRQQGRGRARPCTVRQPMEGSAPDRTLARGWPVHPAQLAQLSPRLEGTAETIPSHGTARACPAAQGTEPFGATDFYRAPFQDTQNTGLKQSLISFGIKPPAQVSSPGKRRGDFVLGLGVCKCLT